VTLVSASGCDSIATLNLSVLSAPATQNINLSGCSSVSVNGITYSSSTIIRDTLKSSGGCDSIYQVTTITINPIVPVTQNFSLSGCSGVVFNGATYLTSTVVRDTVKSYGGCDSIYKVTGIAITPIVPVTFQDTVSGCSSVVFDGATFSASTVIKSIIESVGGCDSVYHITNIIVNPEPFSLTLSASANAVSSGTSVNLVSAGNAPYTVTGWQPADAFPVQDAINQSVVADSTLHITVTAMSNDGCPASAALVLEVKHPDDFYVPNAFSPNGDGINDKFSVYGTTIDHGLLRIYNQWGQLLYQTTDIKDGWDGNYKGVPQPVGVYAYTVVAVMTDGSTQTAHGFLNLIR